MKQEQASIDRFQKALKTLEGKLDMLINERNQAKSELEKANHKLEQYEAVKNRSVKRIDGAIAQIEKLLGAA